MKKSFHEGWIQTILSLEDCSGDSSQSVNMHGTSL